MFIYVQEVIEMTKRQVERQANVRKGVDERRRRHDGSEIGDILARSAQPAREREAREREMTFLSSPSSFQGRKEASTNQSVSTIIFWKRRSLPRIFITPSWSQKRHLLLHRLTWNEKKWNTCLPFSLPYCYYYILKCTCTSWSGIKQVHANKNIIHTIQTV